MSCLTFLEVQIKQHANYATCVSVAFSLKKDFTQKRGFPNGFNSKLQNLQNEWLDAEGTATNVPMVKSTSMRFKCRIKPALDSIVFPFCTSVITSQIPLLQAFRVFIFNKEFILPMDNGY